MAVKVKALITLVVGKAQEFAPGQECEVSDEEAKRLISLGFAERVKRLRHLKRHHKNLK